MAFAVLSRTAVIGLSVLALSAPAVAAHAATGEPCAKQQATVLRHQETLDQLNKNIELLDDTYRGADATAEWAHVNYYEWRDAARMDEISDAEKAHAEQEAAQALQLYTEASAEAKEARAALDAAEKDPQLARTASLLKRAKTALATCLAKS